MPKFKFMFKNIYNNIKLRPNNFDTYQFVTKKALNSLFVWSLKTQVLPHFRHWKPKNYKILKLTSFWLDLCVKILILGLSNQFSGNLGLKMLFFLNRTLDGGCGYQPLVSYIVNHNFWMAKSYNKNKYDSSLDSR